MNNTCRYCAEEVKPAAKVCPHCRQWLSVLSLRNPTFSAVASALLGVVFIVGCLVTFNQMVKSGTDFAPYRDSISVLESRINFQPDQNGEQMLYVVGVLTNQSHLPWRSPQLDLRFFNKAGTLIDAAYASASGIVYPNADLAFRVKSRPNHSTSEYDSCKLYVRWASDPHSRF
jgi:hypothetical protein